MHQDLVPPPCDDCRRGKPVHAAQASKLSVSVGEWKTAWEFRLTTSGKAPLLRTLFGGKYGIIRLNLLSLRMIPHIAPSLRCMLLVSVVATTLSLGACGGAPAFEDPPPSVDAEPAPPKVVVADPVRGAMLFANTPRAGLLICADCHSENPAVNNFGNIWSGRNAVALIQRAVSSNTGGMGYFANLYSAADLADIAAFLGNTPSELQFGAMPLGATSAVQVVMVRTSTKVGMDRLSIEVLGDFKMADTSCTSSVPRFSSCTIALAFTPTRRGTRNGAVLLAHDGTPAPVRIALTGEAL